MLTAERTDASESSENTETGRTQAVIDGFRNPRPPRKRWSRGLLAAVLALLVVVSGLAVPYSLGVLPAPFKPPLPDDAAFAVGDRVVTIAQYDERLKTIGALYGAQPPADPAGQDQFRRDSAKAMMISTVLQDAEAERNLVTPDPKARETLNQLIVSQFGPGPEGYQKFVQGLGEVGTSEQAVLAEIKQQMADTALIGQVTQDVRVGNDELPAEFPKYRDRLGQPEARQLSNIVVATPEQATDVLNRLKAGQPFADVARQSSIDTSTNNKGGDLGELTRDQLQQGYANAAFAAPPGQLFGPVQTPQGWNVGQVVRIRDAVPADYGRNIEQLRSAVTTDRKIQVWSDWLRDRIDSADVRFADAYRPDDPTGLPALARPTS